MIKYLIQFERSGETYTPADLSVEAADTWAMTWQIQSYARRFLPYSVGDPVVAFSFKTGRGTIGDGRFGSFSLMAERGHCPNECPECGADLKKQGHPFAHQHDATGETCAVTWEPLP